MLRLFQNSDDKEEVPVNIESSPQTTPAPSVAAQVQAPSAQPEVDEDGYCIQPKDPLWELQTMKKGGKCTSSTLLMQLVSR